MVAVLIVALLFFAVYAEHIVHQRNNTGVVAWPAAVPAVPASSVVSAGI
jgi:hypothetical protein